MRHEQADTVRNERRNSLSSSSRPVMITPQNRVEKSTAVTTARGNPSVAPPQYFKGVLSAERNLLHNLTSERSQPREISSKQDVLWWISLFARCLRSWAFSIDMCLLMPHHCDISSKWRRPADEVELNGNIVHRGQSHWDKWKSAAGMEHSPSALVQENRL